MHQLTTHIRTWLPLLGLAAATFVFNTSEFIPVGLLTDIAATFHMTEAAASSLISIYAWMVALLSLPLMLLFARANYRTLLLAVIALFIAGHVAACLAPTFALLLAARISVAFAHSLFWALLTPIAVRIAPGGKTGPAVGLVMSGTAIAMIAGIPIGRAIGLYASWRVTFAYIAAAATMVLILLAAALPSVAAGEGFTLREVPRLLRSRKLIALYATTLVVITGNYTVYSYIEPYLLSVAHFAPDTITATLSVFGFAGLMGSYTFARAYDRNPRRVGLATVGGLTAVLLLLPAASMWHTTMIALCIAWGITFTMFDLLTTADVIAASRPADAVAIALYSGIFNAGIACGTMVGAAVLTHTTMPTLAPVAAAIAIAGFACYYLAASRQK